MLLGTCLCRLRRLYREPARSQPKDAPESRKDIVAIIGLDQSRLVNTWGGSSAG